MKKLIIASLLIFTSSSVFAEVKFIENKTVLGQLLIMDVLNRIENGKGILKTPVANLESTITPSFITNPNKRCWMSPQYHSDGSVTPRLKCHWLRLMKIYHIAKTRSFKWIIFVSLLVGIGYLTVELLSLSLEFLYKFEFGCLENQECFFDFWRYLIEQSDQ